MPNLLITDRGTAFSSSEFLKYTKHNNIKHTLIATSCPKANGQVERFNRVIVPLLAKLKEESGKDWDKLLGEAEFLLNNTVNRSINDVPTKLLYGVIQKRKIETGLIKYMEDLNRDIDSNFNLSDIRDNATDSIKRNQEYNKTYHDSHTTKATKYNVDDLVFLRATKTPEENTKLSNKYKGPYVVHKVLDRDRYVIRDIDGYQVSGRVYDGIHGPENIRLYRKYNADNDCPDDVENSDSDNTSFYEDVEFLESDVDSDTH
jgi:hypothetical protein